MVSVFIELIVSKVKAKDQLIQWKRDYQRFLQLF